MVTPWVSSEEQAQARIDAAAISIIVAVFMRSNFRIFLKNATLKIDAKK